MYLESGQWPARFELQKMRCLFLKQILRQDENSQVYKFFQLQLSQPVRGDWVSTCKEDLSQLKIYDSFEDIKRMSETKFKNILKTRMKENALEYLLKRRGSKGQGIQYSNLEMAEYLLPQNIKLNVDEKRRMFSIKNRMVLLPCNFGKPDEKCICGTLENMPHLYSCEYLNETKPIIPYDKLNNGSLKDQIEIFHRFEHNMEIRTELKQKMETGQVNSPCDHDTDPLNCKV